MDTIFGDRNETLISEEDPYGANDSSVASFELNSPFNASLRATAAICLAHADQV